MISINHYLFVSAMIFFIGLSGFYINRKHLISILMSIELILVSININMVAFSVFLNDILGQVFTFFILSIAATESAIGLALIVIFFKNKKSIAIDSVSDLKG